MPASLPLRRRGRLLRHLRRTAGDESRIVLQALAEGGRRLAVAGDLVEPAAGIIHVAGFQPGEAEHLPRRVAPGLARSGERLQGLADGRLVGAIHAQHRRA